jgi:hypothetical protein
MIEFNFSELNLLSKLLNKVKYSELDAYELNQFANSPITNRIMEKIQTEFKPLAGKFRELKTIEFQNLFYKKNTLNGFKSSLTM